MKTLYVVYDDNDSLTELYEQLVRASPNYNVIATINPYKALNMATNARPGPPLLITGLLKDARMTGPELIRRVHELGSRTKFILCSEHDESELNSVMEELRNVGIDIRYIKFSDVTHPRVLDEGLAALVKSILGE